MTLQEGRFRNLEPFWFGLNTVSYFIFRSFMALEVFTFGIDL